MAAGGVPEGLPLCWEVSVSGWNAEEECIIRFEGLWVDDWVVGLWWCVHLRLLVSDVLYFQKDGRTNLGQDFLGKSLWDLENVGLNTGLLKASLLGLSELLDVAIHGVLGDKLALHRCCYEYWYFV